MRIHISLLNYRGEEKMPARPCPVLSGTVRSVRSVRSGLLGPGHWSGPDGPDRTGQGRHRALAKSSLALSGPVRSAPVQDARTGRTGPDRTGPPITSSFFV